MILLSLLMLATAALPSTVLGANPVVRGVVVRSGLVHPWDLDFLPGGLMIVTERPGRVRIYASSQPGAALLGTTNLFGVRAEGEAGVMGITVDHLFHSNRLVYICASRMFGGQWVNQVMRFRVTSSWTLAHDRNLVATGIFASTIHNGCAVEEGPDQKIWVSTGDGAVPSRAQNRNSLNGKILRINRDGTIPSDNPIMPGNSSRTFVYSMGHRNPQGIAFTPTAQFRVYVPEHGPERDDEINWILPGRNYGWPCRTGFNRPYQSCSGTFTNPVWASGNGTIAVSGAAIVAGTNWQSYAGDFFVSQLKESDLRRFDLVPASPGVAGYRNTFFNNLWGRLRGAVLGPDNLLYLTTSNGSNDRIIRVIPSSS